MRTNAQLMAENQAIRDMLAAGPERELLALPGVVHVSVGLKQTQGRATEQLCIRVYVREKRDRDDLPAEQVIPRQINGVATDVNTVGEFEFQTDNSRYRPIKGGIQITNRIVDVNDAGTGTQLHRGTLGCLAIDRTDSAPVLLSNWHVLQANTGRRGDKIFQPAPTSVPPAGLADLPLRPSDDTDKIGILRRSVINNKVDGAIAAIDVSSCCHCCGIHYTNEVNGLSVGGRPPRNTIVGDQRAVSGMVVFKVGQSTLRQEGVVVDDNHPTFSIVSGGTTFTFDGQIAMQGVDPAVPFSTRGDSGSVVINLENKVVGLLFAAGANVPVHGAPQPFVSLANHIGDVLAALNIRIPYAPEVVTTAGAALSDLPALEAPIPKPYRALRERMAGQETTAHLFALGERHREEVVGLINHRRPVTVAWHRCQGPALLALLMAAVRDRNYRLPARVKGVALHDALGRMRQVLLEHGGAALQASLNMPEADRVIRACESAHDLDEVLERIATGKALCVSRGGAVR